MTIKNKRLELNLTQEQLARKLKMNLRTYTLIEKNNTCSLKHAFKIAEFFNCTTEEIFKNKKEIE